MVIVFVSQLCIKHMIDIIYDIRMLLHTIFFSIKVILLTFLLFYKNDK